MFIQPSFMFTVHSALPHQVVNLRVLFFGGRHTHLSCLGTWLRLSHHPWSPFFLGVSVFAPQTAPCLREEQRRLLIAGVLAGGTSRTVTAPLERLKVMMQTSTTERVSTLDTARAIYHPVGKCQVVGTSTVHTPVMVISLIFSRKHQPRHTRLWYM